MRSLIVGLIALLPSMAQATVYGTPSTCDLLASGVAAEDIMGTNNFYLDDQQIMPPRNRCDLSTADNDHFVATCDLGKPQHFRITRSADQAVVVYTDHPEDPGNSTFILARCP